MESERHQRIRENILAQHRATRERKLDILREDLRQVRHELLAAKNRWTDLGSEHKEIGAFLITLANRLARIQSTLDSDDTTIAVRVVPPNEP